MWLSIMFVLAIAIMVGTFMMIPHIWSWSFRKFQEAERRKLWEEQGVE